MKPRLSKLIFLVPIGLAAITLFVFLGGQIVRLLWNGLLPPLFGWPEVTFWQAVGLLALCRILFGGFTLRDGDKRSSMRTPMADRVADRVVERWEKMTPEDRERFRQRLRERGVD